MRQSEMGYNERPLPSLGGKGRERACPKAIRWSFSKEWEGPSIPQWIRLSRRQLSSPPVLSGPVDPMA